MLNVKQVLGDNTENVNATAVHNGRRRLAPNPIAFSEDVYYLAIDNDIAYMTSWPHRIKRFNLKTQTFLTDLRAPAYNQMGIKIYQGMLYYADYYKRYVGYFPVSDFKN